jgi:hypothetical protein
MPKVIRVNPVDGNAVRARLLKIKITIMATSGERDLVKEFVNPLAWNVDENGQVSEEWHPDQNRKLLSDAKKWLLLYPKARNYIWREMWSKGELDKTIKGRTRSNTRAWGMQGGRPESKRERF